MERIALHRRLARPTRVVKGLSAIGVSARASAHLPLWVAVLIAGTACVQRESSVVVHEGPRSIVSGRIVVQWTKVIGEEDTLFALPSKLATDGRVVAVLDPVANRVIGLERETGKVVWRYGSTGSGPGEFRGPSEILARKGGGFIVFDPANARITDLDDAGMRLRERAAVGVSAIRSACLLRDGGLLAFELALDHPIVHLDSTFRSVKRIPLPWTIDLGTNGEARQPEQNGNVSEIIRQSQGVLTPTPDGGGCIFGRQTADGLAYIQGDSVRWRRDYVASPPVESLKVATSAAISILARGDTVFVPFHGTGRRRGRLIDLYRSSDGEYLASLETPGGMSWVDLDSSGFVVLQSTSTGSKISAWTLRR